MTELKPCPYCGEEPHLYTRKTWFGYLLRCERADIFDKPDCYMMNTFAHSEEKVMERWNRKAGKIALKVEKTKKKEELVREKYKWRKKW